MKGRCFLPTAWDESQEKDTDICKSLVLHRHLWQTGPTSSPERDTLLLFHGYYYLYYCVIIQSAPGSGTSHSFHGYLLIQAFWKEMRSIQTWKIKEELSSIKTISLSYKDVLSLVEGTNSVNHLMYEYCYLGSLTMLCMLCYCWVAKSGLIFLWSMDYSLPVFSVHGISQTRTLERVTISFSRGSSWPRDTTCISCIDR